MTEKLTFFLPLGLGQVSISLDRPADLRPRLVPSTDVGEGTELFQAAVLDFNDIVMRMGFLYRGIERGVTRLQPSSLDTFRHAHSHSILSTNDIIPEGITSVKEMREWFVDQFGRNNLDRIGSEVFSLLGGVPPPSGEASFLFSAALVLADFKDKEWKVAWHNPFDYDYERPEIPWQRVYNTLLLSLAIYTHPPIEDEGDEALVLRAAKSLHQVILSIRDERIPRAEPAGMARFRRMLQDVYGPKFLEASSGQAMAELLSSSSTATGSTATFVDGVEVIPKGAGAMARRQADSGRELLSREIDLEVLYLLSLPHNLGSRWADAEGLPDVVTVGDLFDYMRTTMHMTGAGEKRLREFLLRLSAAFPKIMSGAQLSGNLIAATMLSDARAHRTMAAAPGLPLLDVMFDTMADAWRGVIAYEEEKKKAGSSGGAQSQGPRIATIGEGRTRIGRGAPASGELELEVSLLEVAADEIDVEALLPSNTFPHHTALARGGHVVTAGIQPVSCSVRAMFPAKIPR